MNILTILVEWIAVLAIGVIYGADVFFTVVGRKALSFSSDRALTEVLGRIHETADARIPLFGVIGAISLVVLVVLNGLTSISGWFYVIAIVAMVLYLFIYIKISKPVNAKLTEAANTMKILNNARELQNRWDSVIAIRALLLTFILTLICLSDIF